MDVKQGQNKEGKTVLYLVFEYMDTDLKKFIKSFRGTGESIPVNTVKVHRNTLLVLISFQKLQVCCFSIEHRVYNFCFCLKSLMYQLCKGVAFCHGHGILHR